MPWVARPSVRRVMRVPAGAVKRWNANVPPSHGPGPTSWAVSPPPVAHASVAAAPWSACASQPAAQPRTVYVSPQAPPAAPSAKMAVSAATIPACLIMELRIEVGDGPQRPHRRPLPTACVRGLTHLSCDRGFAARDRRCYAPRPSAEYACHLGHAERGNHLWDVASATAHRGESGPLARSAVIRRDPVSSLRRPLDEDLPRRAEDEPSDAGRRPVRPRPRHSVRGLRGRRPCRRALDGRSELRRPYRADGLRRRLDARRPAGATRRRPSDRARHGL